MEENNHPYTKEFTKWNEIKAVTEKRNARHIFIREGAVWLMRVGVNIGSELDGKGEEFLRPVIVIRKINNYVFFGVPISSKITTDYFRHNFTLFGEPRDAVLSHIRSFDVKRCMRFMTMLDTKTIYTINRRISDIFLKAETPRPPMATGENLETP